MLEGSKTLLGRSIVVLSLAILLNASIYYSAILKLTASTPPPKNVCVLVYHELNFMQ